MNFAIVLDSNKGYYCGKLTTVNSIYEDRQYTYTH